VCLLSLPPPYASFIYTLARYRTEGLGKGKPTVNFILAHRPVVAQLIEDHVEGRF
jgi:hypothetical protein